MKKFIVTLICTGMLIGCSESKTVSDITVQETNNITETETVYEEHDAPFTNPVDTNANPKEVLSHYTFDVQTDGVNVYYDNKKVQFLTADCSWHKDKTYDYLKYEDFDFDGYSDLFVPEVFGTANAYGKYFRFDTNKGVFVIWDTMDDYFNNGLVYVDKENQTLILSTKDGAVNSDEKTYKWNEKQLPQLIKRRERYMKGPEMVVDSFNIKDNQEILIKREIYNDETQDYVECFVSPSQIYFEKTDTALNVRLRSNNEIVQVIEGDFSGYHYIAPDNWLEREQSPPDEITEGDFNGDGEIEYFVKDGEYDGKDYGKYYRFNYDTFLFEEFAPFDSLTGFAEVE